MVEAIRIPGKDSIWVSISLIWVTSEECRVSGDGRLASADRHFSLIRKKYPDLKMYLVLSLPSGQTRIGSALLSSASLEE